MEVHSLPRTGRIFLPRSPRVLGAFTDERLVEQVRRGNEAAFEVLFDRHHRAILSFCRHMLASADEAEDAVQQTFVSAYHGVRSAARELRFKPWLYTIARNRCLSMLRARREQTAVLADVPTAGLAEEVQHRADLRELLDDLRELPVDQRAALVLAELGDLSHAEVGAVVGCEVAKVKSLVFQARSALIETRKARAIPCHEIREQLATLTGGALRRGPLRRHLRACEGCAEFRDEVRRQRRALAAVLPVVPTLGLKHSALAAIGLGGGGGGAGVAASGGLASMLTSGAAVKLVALTVVTVAGVGAGIVLDQQSSAPSAQAAGGQAVAPSPVTAGHGPGARVAAGAPPARQVSHARRAGRRSVASTPAPVAKRGSAQPRERHARLRQHHAQTPTVNGGQPQAGPAHPAQPSHPAHPAHPVHPATPPAAPAPPAAAPPQDGHGHPGDGSHPQDGSGDQQGDGQGAQGDQGNQDRHGHRGGHGRLDGG
jgi:RNA polymerase sigma factor (sigma-70 family)